MKALILEGAQTPVVAVRSIEAYAEVARRHGGLDLWILVRPGVFALIGDTELPGVRMVEELADYDVPGVLERRAMDLQEKERFDILYSPREGDIVRAARLREKYGIPGQGVESAWAYRDKLIMKTLVAEAGVPVWPVRRVDDGIDFWEAVADLGYPCVVKPRFDRGDMHFGLIADEQSAPGAVRGVFERMPIEVPAHYLAESFCGHHMCHVDGIWHEDRFLYVLTSSYLGFGAARAVDKHTGKYGSVQFDPESERGRRFVDHVERVIRALPAAGTFSFHAEVWEDEATGHLYLNEIAARTGGHFVHTNQTTSIGVDPDALWLALLAGLAPEAMGFLPEGRPVPCAGFGLPYRSGRLIRIDPCDVPSVRKLVLPYEAPGTFIKLPRSPFDTIGDVTVVADDYAGLDGEIRSVLAWAEKSMVIEAVVPVGGLGGPMDRGVGRPGGPA